MSTILVIEDEPMILEGLKDNLEFEGHAVITASDGAAGLRIAHERQPDLIVLDIMLPGMSGFEVCRKLREARVTTPVLMLTARGEEVDRVIGLDLGADDYMVKPFSVRELLARVRALLRRAQPQSADPQDLRFGDVEIDFLRYEARKAGEPVDLTRKEFAVLRLLGARPGVVVSREELFEKVWGYDARQTTRTVDNHIATLRAKLDDEASGPKHLHTVHGIGYKLIP